jgi:hypothetical protein
MAGRGRGAERGGRNHCGQRNCCLAAVDVEYLSHCWYLDIGLDRAYERIAIKINSTKESWISWMSQVEV